MGDPVKILVMGKNQDYCEIEQDASVFQKSLVEKKPLCLYSKSGQNGTPAIRFRSYGGTYNLSETILTLDPKVKEKGLELSFEKILKTPETRIALEKILGRANELAESHGAPYVLIHSIQMEKYLLDINAIGSAQLLIDEPHC